MLGASRDETRLRVIIKKGKAVQVEIIKGNNACRVVSPHGCSRVLGRVGLVGSLILAEKAESPCFLFFFCWCCRLTG